MDSIRIASSFVQQTEAVIADLYRQLAGQEYALVIYFAADTYDPGCLAAGMRRVFRAPAAVIGCTTAGEIGLAGYQNGSVVAVGFPAADFSVATAVIPDLSEFDMAECQRRVEDAVRRSAWQRDARGFTNTVAFVLVDGLSLREESVGRAVQLMIGDIPVVGGSAGDSLHFRQTLVYHDDKAIEDAAVMAIISTRLPFRIIKTQHFERTEERMVVTGARPRERVVTELNALPAAVEYASVIGVPVAALSSAAFAAHPVLVRIGGQDYVRSIQKVNPDQSLSFYCAIDEGIVLSLGRAMDALANLERAFDAVIAEIGSPQAIMACDCILRNVEFRQTGQADAMSKAFRERHVVGFSSFGELYLGVHINQTFTGIAFGDRAAVAAAGTFR